ncbi:MAG TPA: NAD(P)-dependent oxidoreductase [Bacteroidia bacterium]|nr:NAD(P)-dependent oxidoreductase [Bacteroidia bacterium]
MKIGILREGKKPRDRRVPFTPAQCILLQREFNVGVIVQPSAWRAFSDDEYRAAAVRIEEDLSDCEALFGIKEVPAEELIPGKKYLFFSHTIKKQPHNRALMQAMIAKKIQMIDYECLTDPDFNRIIGFGHFAGIVGAYNGIRGYGLRYGFYDLKPAWQCHDLQEVKEELKKVKLPNMKLIVTGNGRVANGAIELLGLLQLRRVTPYEFTHYSFREAVYTQLHSYDYNEAKAAKQWDRDRFYSHPEEFRSTFARFTPHCDLLIHSSYWDPRAPRLFEKEDMRSPEFRISVIADITCDINGAIPSTTKPSSIAEPFYGYNPVTGEAEENAFASQVITVMAIDNLPCELPRDASESFGKELIEKVIPAVTGNDVDGLIERGSICKDGRLMARFDYLADYAYGDKNKANVG